jgi:protein TonB
METIKSVKADLENKRMIFREIGLIAALLVVFVAFNLKTNTKENSSLDYTYETDIAEEIIPVTVQETKPPPPAPPPMQTTKITIVDNDVEIDDEIDLNVEIDQETAVEEYVPYVPVEEEEEEVIESDQIFVVVESMPEFPGGYGALMEYLQQNLKYPSIAKEMGIKGRVFLSFVVEIDGSVTDVRVLRGIGGGCDEEAVRVVEKMPKWKPGLQRNRPVRVQFNLPVKFTLQ